MFRPEETPAFFCFDFFTFNPKLIVCTLIMQLLVPELPG